MLYLVLIHGKLKMSVCHCQNLDLSLDLGWAWCTEIMVKEKSESFWFLLYLLSHSTMKENSLGTLTKRFEFWITVVLTLTVGNRSTLPFYQPPTVGNTLKHKIVELRTSWTTVIVWAIICCSQKLTNQNRLFLNTNL